MQKMSGVMGYSGTLNGRSMCGSFALNMKREIPTNKKKDYSTGGWYSTMVSDPLLERRPKLTSAKATTPGTIKAVIGAAVLRSHVPEIEKARNSLPKA